jgi:two-component system, OmpR family, sensor kinase
VTSSRNSGSPGPGDIHSVVRARRQIAVLIGAAILVGVLVASAVTYVSVVRASDAETRQTLAAVAANADSVRDVPPGVWLVARSPHGRVLRSPGLPVALSSQSLLARAPRHGARVQEMHVGSRDFLVRAQVRRRWVVAAVKDLSLRLNEQRRLGWGLALASLFGLVVAVLVGYLLAGRATHPLAEALSRQRRFVADASHELRTPLSRVLLRAEMVEEELPTAPRARLGEDVGALLQDARGMAELLNDLLLSAQLRTRSRPANLVDMEAVVRETVSLDRIRAEQADVTLTAQVLPSPGGLHAWGSQPALRRAVGALVDNAIAHTPRGGTVAIAARASDGQVRVDVVDDGEGFDVAHLPDLVRPFSRGHDDPRRFGLGLALVSDVLDAHRGSLTAQSSPGRGTRWTIRLPLASAAGGASRIVDRAP